jgi:hypothetical protein
MSSRRVRLYPTLKHAGYSTTALLPGESRTDFEKLHRDLIKELQPKGALEDDIVYTIARLTWRKQNLATFRKAEVAKEDIREIKYRQVLESIERSGEDDENGEGQLDQGNSFDENGSESEEPEDPIGEEGRRELGTAYALAEMGYASTTNRLLDDLEIERRLDGQVDSCLKRLLFLRGLKSVTPVASSTPGQSRPAVGARLLMSQENSD